MLTMFPTLAPSLIEASSTIIALLYAAAVLPFFLNRKDSKDEDARLLEITRSAGWLFAWPLFIGGILQDGGLTYFLAGGLFAVGGHNDGYKPLLDALKPARNWLNRKLGISSIQTPTA